MYDISDTFLKSSSFQEREVMIQFSRFDQFELESHNNCIFDYLELREGGSADGPLIGR